ncbi:MAG: SGNH/GDSL hydrolase family protein [Planctomycetia bacterium]|nr:SGNH/GDSL hydrolase family protein [Planctomycetia bacterium]
MFSLFRKSNRRASSLVVPSLIVFAIVLPGAPQEARLLCSRAYGAEPVKSVAVEGSPLRWFDAKEIGIEGRGWSDVNDFYDRLPSKAEKTVPKSVWGLSKQSAGMLVRFRAQTPSIHVFWGLRSPNLAMPHMPATGVSGVDLYGRNDAGQWRWIAGGRPTAQTQRTMIASELPPGEREYLLYLPLYNGVSDVQIGIPADATLTRSESEAAKKKPIVFYGTSIMQGGCASRPGMAHASILGRRLDRPIINLGFSGSGKMEIELANLLAELDPALYVIDCLPNIDAKQVTERTEPLVAALRKAHPTTPIMLVEDRTYSDADWAASKRKRNDTSRAAYKAAYERLLKAGVTGLTYVEGEQLLREDYEDTVDGSHPTDLGFMHYADVLEPILRKALGEPAKSAAP